jgi:pilus assembly protein Flp/PilA
MSGDFHLPSPADLHRRGTKMLAYIRNVATIKNEEGASAVEYGLLVAAIAALIVIVVFALGGIIKGVFKNTCDAIGSNDQNASTPASCAN